MKSKKYVARALVITGHNHASVIKQCDHSGIVDAFVTKPLSTAAFLNAFYKYVCPLSQYYRTRSPCLELISKTRHRLFGVEKNIALLSEEK